MDHKRESEVIDDRQTIYVHADDQVWAVTRHAPAVAPDGRPHGSAGICVTPAGEYIFVSVDGIRWELPAGRPEALESWEQTLRREVQEEACATVVTARLLGFSRGHCISGHEAGLVLVRAIWRAEVELQPWRPRFEMHHRRVVPVVDVLPYLAEHDGGHLPIYRRAMIEAELV